jgi:hypothetical protein
MSKDLTYSNRLACLHCDHTRMHQETRLGHMNEPTQITDMKKRYAAGVL